MTYTSPDKFFNWMVEVKFNGTTGICRLLLNLLNKVFVGYLCKSAAFIGIKINIVTVNFCGVFIIFMSTPLAVNFYFMVLECYKWKSKTWISTKPKL